MSALNTAWRALSQGFMRAVHLLGTINAHILFGALYIVGVGIYALVWRIARLFESNSESTGWVSEEGRSPTIDDLRRQF